MTFDDTKKKDKSFWYTVHEKTIKDKFIYKKVYSAKIIFLTKKKYYF